MALTDPPKTGIVLLLEPNIVESGENSVRIVFPMKPEFAIPPGVMQGGIVAAMLDMAMAFAASGAISTASMQIDILRPVVGSEFTVDGRVNKQGRRIVFAEAEMHDSAGKLMARGRQTAVPPQ